MFDPDTGVPMTEEAEVLVSKYWTNTNVHTAAAQDFQVSYAALEQGTQCFSWTMRIGGGGSCEVYRGIVYNVHVAIKVLKPDGGSGDDIGANWSESTLSLEGKQFFAEMRLLKAVRHPNICRLLAVSLDGPQRW